MHETGDAFDHIPTVIVKLVGEFPGHLAEPLLQQTKLGSKGEVCRLA